MPWRGKIFKIDDTLFSDVFKNTTNYRVENLPNADAIFGALKSRQCDAAVAPTGVLREVVVGLNRDGIPFEYHKDAITVAYERQIEATIKAQLDAKRKAANDAMFALAQLGVLGENSDDITALIAAHDTAHVIRNLSGDPSFTKPATLCFPFQKPEQSDASSSDGRFFLNVLEKIKKKGGNGLIPVPCDTTNFGQFDILVFVRGQLENTSGEQIQKIADAVADGAFVKFGDVYKKTAFLDESEGRKQKIETDDRQRAQERSKSKEEFEKRDASAVSAIYIASPASAICIAGPVDGRLASKVKAADSPFADLVGNPTTFRETATAETIFLAIKQKECLAAVAATQVLRDVIKGLDRDGIQFDYHSGSL